MKKPKTKAEVRAEIQAQVSDFLSEGGAVHRFAQGESNISPTMHPFKVQSLDKPSDSRTPVQDTIAAIENRRKPQSKARTTVKRPKKILLKDDFGQPLRWVWEE